MGGKFHGEEDEVKLLEEYSEFVKTDGETFSDKYVKFLAVCSAEMRKKYSRKQISKKLNRLKEKYENQRMNNGSLPPTLRPNEARLFHLSQSLWGTSNTPAADSDDQPRPADSSSKSTSRSPWQDLQRQELELYAQQLALEIRACKLRLQQYNLNSISKEQQRDLLSCESVKKDVVDGNTSNVVELLQIDECESNEKKSRKKKGKKRKLAGNVESLELDTVEEAVGEDPNHTRTFKELQPLESGVIIEELVMGDPNKKPASKGLQVKVHFTGKVKDSGHIIESANNRPRIICLGSEDLIDGFSEGVEGMRVGGKRKLIIPPSMGFGDGGFGEQVPPNSWLEYEVELLSVRSASKRV